MLSSTEKTAIDKAAANRFIKHAIAQAVRIQDQPQPIDKEPTPGPSKIQAQPVPTGAANKILARAEWEKEVREDTEDEEDLEIFEEAEGHANEEGDVGMPDANASAPTLPPIQAGEAAIPSGQLTGMFA